jgi:hypothetical protein
MGGGWRVRGRGGEPENTEGRRRWRRRAQRKRVSMIVRPMMYKGHCQGCGRNRENVFGAVVIILEHDDGGDVDEFDGEWLCLSCAKKLAAKITKAVDACQAKIAGGLIYKMGRWWRKRAKAAPPTEAEQVRE